jgi:hypothetical protein
VGRKMKFEKYHWVDSPDAFPRAGFEGPDSYCVPRSGMGLWEYYAGQAMIGLVNSNVRPPDPERWHDLACDAFDYAEAMLDVRKARCKEFVALSDEYKNGTV